MNRRPRTRCFGVQIQISMKIRYPNTSCSVPIPHPISANEALTATFILSASDAIDPFGSTASLLPLATAGTNPDAYSAPALRFPPCSGD